ncbi:MAG: class I SAM-dependent methyltransferase [Candidatus Lokiarchaeota archaeon]|nr:class I SAM-dependent methyltransferase [Candidatus Lokiarchaeota archaeon]
MLHNIPELVKKRMVYLEKIDAEDRINGTPRMERLRQIPPETGKFLSIIAAGAPNGEFIEIGTSGGYSTMWIALACIERGIKVKTFEILEKKIRLAKETFRESKMANYVELVEGDARGFLKEEKNISFCFLDAEKEVYADCYDLIIPNLVKGGLLVADNAINFYDVLKPMIDKALSDERVDALIVPIGKGELLCRKI